MCKELLLIIEVDGITHSYEEVRKRDKIRQADLEHAGFTVMRFTDEEVLNHMHKVHDAIEDKVVEIMKARGVAPRVRSRRQK